MEPFLTGSHPPEPFRPTRPRASMSVLPSSTAGATTTTAFDENALSATHAERRKRAQSLGGDEARKKQRSLSPAKLARRSLVPRRSILKAPTAFDQTATLGQNRDGGGGGDSSSDEGETMDFTHVVIEDTTMARRRVSFAPSAYVRTFSPKKKTALARAESSFASDGTNDEEDSSFTLSEQSMEMADNDTTSAFAAHFVDPATSQDVYEDESSGEDEDDDGMDLADTNEVTAAFARELSDSERREVEQRVRDRRQSRISLGKFNDDEDEELRRELAAEAALRASDAFATVDEPVQTVRRQPRFSEVVRNENAEDEAIRQELVGRSTTRSLPQVDEMPETSDIDEAAGSSEDEDDEALAMELTTALGQVIDGLAVESVQQAVEEDLTSRTMDLTMADADRQLTGDVVEQDSATTTSVSINVATSTTSTVTTTSMVETTSHGRILPSGPATTPAERRRQEHLFRKLSLTGSLPAGHSLSSPGRLASPRRGAPGVLPSPRRATISTLAQPNLEQAAVIFSGSSSVGAPRPPVVTKAPLSPRRARPPSPERAERRKTLSPVKVAPVEPTPSSASESVAGPTSRPPSSLATPAAPASRPSSPAKKTGPLNRSVNASATTPHRPSSPPKKTAPLSAGRSPGGSLSLRGLLQEQLSLKQDHPKTSDASSSPAEMLINGDDTGSSFDAVPEQEAPKAPQMSLNEFFEESGTGFMADVVKLTGVSLGNKRRKSLAPIRKSSGPPTFADVAVAGASKALFHQLYQNDQLRLSEDIQTSMDALAHIDEAVQRDYPKLFEEWAEASEEQRASMTSQFRMIKSFYHLQGRIEWNEMRAENYQAIINVMRDSLEGLKADTAVLAETPFEDVIPDLELRREALLRELQAEEARDAALEACDPMELGELHAALVEQGDQLKIHGAQLSEVEGQLEQLETRATELAAQEAQMSQEKATMLRTLEEGQCFTKMEVSRLQAEFEALQHLHGWRIEEFADSAVKLRHLDDFSVILEVNDRGRVHSTTLRLDETKPAGLRRDVTTFLFYKLVAHVANFMRATGGDVLAPRTVLSRIATMWTGARRLRQEALEANQRFPTVAIQSNDPNMELSVDDDNDEVLKIISDVHVPRVRSTFQVVLELRGEEFAWPTDAEQVVTKVGCDVLVKYGRVDVAGIKYAVRECLDNGGRGALLSALDIAEAMYNE